ncbi:MAG TPA: prepilin-type N-terminal cleavage/methylation domain-containing protein [Solirubrobacteraceae bacterium]|nr:prepilin-type N-terminal cleavage/methylation domain-containing protein [Solirubrobacteraceae bacterium]
MSSLRTAQPFDRARARVIDDAGFTLVEVLITIVVLTVGLMGTLAALRTSDRTTLTNRERQAETSLAREVLEDAGSLPSWELSTYALPGALQPLITGARAPAGGVLLVTRGPATYSVTPTACSIDDPTDGSASSHTSANPPGPNRTWCTGLVTSASTDSTPDDEERVSVTVAPSTGSAEPTVQQSTLIVDRPPVVSAITVAGGACNSGPPITCTSAQPLTATATTTTPATSFRWLVNGVLQSTMTTSQLTWQPPSGAASYTISAQAEYGQGPVGAAATVQVRVTS